MEDLGEFGYGDKIGAEYTHPVNGMGPKELSLRMNSSLTQILKNFPPRTGVMLFVFDFGRGGGMAYGSNGDREGCIKALKEWISKQE